MKWVEGGVPTAETKRTDCTASHKHGYRADHPPTTTRPKKNGSEGKKVRSTMGRKFFGRRKRTRTCETAETESPYLNWRACPASPRFRPPIHPPTTLFFTTSSPGGGGGAATHLEATHTFGSRRPPPPDLPNTLWRQVPRCYCDHTSHTHTPTRPPHRLSPRWGWERNQKGCGIAQQQTD